MSVLVMLRSIVYSLRFARAVRPCSVQRHELIKRLVLIASVTFPDLLSR